MQYKHVITRPPHYILMKMQQFIHIHNIAHPYTLPSPHKIILGQQQLADETENIKSYTTCGFIDYNFWILQYLFHKML